MLYMGNTFQIFQAPWYQPSEAAHEATDTLFPGPRLPRSGDPTTGSDWSWLLSSYRRRVGGEAWGTKNSNPTYLSFKIPNSWMVYEWKILWFFVKMDDFGVTHFKNPPWNSGVWRSLRSLRHAVVGSITLSHRDLIFFVQSLPVMVALHVAPKDTSHKKNQLLIATYSKDEMLHLTFLWQKMILQEPENNKGAPGRQSQTKTWLQRLYAVRLYCHLPKYISQCKSMIPYHTI